MSLRVLLCNPWSLGDHLDMARFSGKSTGMEMRRFNLRDPEIVDGNSIVSSSSPLPYGLLCIGATAELEGHRVSVYDRNKDPRSVQDALHFKPEVVGLSVMTGPCILDAIQISEAAKNKDPDTKVVWGGIHPTFFPEQVLANKNVDFVLKGQADNTFPRFLGYLEGRDDGDIPGLSQKTGGRILHNEELPFVSDLDSLPFPAWHLVNVEGYFRTPYGRKRGININTSRGCPFNCAYCYNLRFNQRKYSCLSAERVIEQLRFLQEKYRIDYVNFLEDNFTCNKARLKSICAGMISDRIDILWECESRIGFLKREEYELMKEAGCVAVGLGVESGSPRMLKLLRKGITPEQSIDTFNLLSEIGMMAHAYIMVGLPTETVDDFHMTLQLVDCISPKSYTDMMLFRPYPGTDLYDFCIERSLFHPPEDLEGWADISDLHSWRHNLSEIPQELIMNAMIENRKRNRLRIARNAFIKSPLNFISLRGFSNFLSYFRTLAREL